MKILMFASMLIGCICVSQAQEIEAKTSAGKKVFLNINNYTWR